MAGGDCEIFQFLLASIYNLKSQISFVFFVVYSQLVQEVVS